MTPWGHSSLVGVLHNGRLPLLERIHIVPGQKPAFVYDFHISYFIIFSRKIYMAAPYSLDLRKQVLKDYDNGTPIEDLTLSTTK